MKTLIVGFLLAASAFAAASTVTISIKVDAGPVIEATLSADAVQAIVAFIAEQKNDDGTPKYKSISELLIKHFRDSLATPLVQRYSAAIKAADAARDEAEAAAVIAAAGTVVVK